MLSIFHILHKFCIQFGKFKENKILSFQLYFQICFLFSAFYSIGICFNKYQCFFVPIIFILLRVSSANILPELYHFVCIVLIVDVAPFRENLLP